MIDAHALADLIQRVPVLAVDVPSAEARGDHAAIAYALAIETWRAEAALILALAEAEDARPPDAYVRIAAASALMRAP